MLSTSLSATTEMGIPDVRAIIAGTQPANPTSMFEFASPSMMSFPLCAVIFLISMPCCSKNPFLMPRSSGSVLAIGSTPTVRLTVACAFPGAPAAPPANRAATTRIAQPTTSGRRPGFDPTVFIPYIPPCRGAPSPTSVDGASATGGAASVALDEPVDVRALVRELG